MHCAACGAANPLTTRFCVNCGAGLAGLCVHCGGQLPPRARFCPLCGRPTTHSLTGAKAGTKESVRLTAVERRQVTVLFADFAGFTSFVHKQDVEEVRDYMTSIWTRLDEIIAAHGGTTEKHIGDAVMAGFGARQAGAEDPVQAVRAALAMQSVVSGRRPEVLQPELQMRIGIHTGLVVVGPLGATGEIVATGDTVNLANRLEQNAPLGGVLISHHTYRLVYGHFDVQALPPLTVKGRTEPIQTYLVLRAKPRAVAMQLRGVEGVRTAMVGRELELNRLQSALQNVITAREPQVFTIV